MIEHERLKEAIEAVRAGRSLDPSDAEAIVAAVENSGFGPETGRPRFLLRYDREYLTPSKAAARHSPPIASGTATAWAKAAGIAYQIGGRGSLVKIHPVGWALLLAGDQEALEDLKAGRATARVRMAYAEQGIALPPDPAT